MFVATVKCFTLISKTRDFYFVILERLKQGGIVMIALILILTGLLYIFKIIDVLGIPIFIVFLILQLCGVITWAWILIFLPLIIWAATLLLTFVCIALMTYCAENV